MHGEQFKMLTKEEVIKILKKELPCLKAVFMAHSCHCNEVK